MLAGGLSPAGAIAQGDPAFDAHEVVLGTAARQTVLTGFLLGRATAEIAAVGIAESGEARLEIYAFDGTGWARQLDSSLGAEVLFVDVATVGGRDRLLVYQAGRLSWFDPGSETLKALVSVALDFNAEPSALSYGGAEPKGPFDEGEIPHVDVTRDLNLDGRDDLVMPAADGFWISTQSSDGTFAEPVKLGPAEPFRDRIAFDETRSYGEVGVSALTAPWYLSRVHQLDYDLDGRSDLVFWNEGRFDVHLQDARGGFDPQPESFTPDVPFDSDGAYSLLFGFGDESLFSLALGLRKSTPRTVLHSFRDMNGDGVADLVTLTLSGRSLLRQRTRFEVRHGSASPDGVRFDRDVGSAVRPRARAPLGYATQWLRDVDDDGQVDVMCGHVKTGPGRVIRALVAGSVAMGLEVYRSEDGVYPERATATRKITAGLGIRGGRDRGFFPAVLVGDVNGDGHSDVVVGKNRTKLQVFMGGSGPELLASQPLEVAVPVPGDERNSWLVDLNRDGREDVLMHHPSATAPHRVTLLIGR